MQSTNERDMWWKVFTLTGDLETYLHYKTLVGEHEGIDTIGELQNESDHTETE